MKKLLTACNLCRFSTLKWVLFLLIVQTHGLAFASELYDPISVYLTWQRKPDTTMTVQWISTVDRTQDIVEYQSLNETTWHQARGMHAKLPGVYDYLVHRVELSGLEPGTDYRFRTGSDALTFKFRTMPSNADGPIKF